VFSLRSAPFKITTADYQQLVTLCPYYSVFLVIYRLEDSEAQNFV